MKRWMRCSGVVALAMVWGAATAATSLADARGRPADPALSSGTVVWAQETASGHTLVARRLLANGLPQRGKNAFWKATNPTQPDGGTGDQRWPLLAGRLLAWSERPVDRSDYDVYLQMLDDHGRPSGAPIVVADGPSDQRHPAIGGFCMNLLVLWSDDRHDDGDIYGRWFYGQNLRPNGPPVWMVDSPGAAGEPYVNLVSYDPQHQQLLFTDDRDGNLDIYSVTISTLPQTPVDPRAGHVPVIAGSLDEHGARMAGNPPMLVWTQDTTDEGPDVVGQRFASNGLPRGRRIVIAGGPGAQEWPALTQTEGGWVAAWTTNVSGDVRVDSAEIQPNGVVGRRQVDLTAGLAP
jgi:hypothetical protein